MAGRRRDTSVLAVGSAVSGVLAYVFFVLATRALGATEAAPVTVLWTYWSFSAAALTFPVQHWIARSTAAIEGERGVREALPRVAAVIVALSLGIGALAWLGRERLFHSESIWFPLLVAVVTLGAGFIGVVRGGLTARRRFTALGLSLVAENAVRCGSAALLVAFGAHSAVGFGVCLAIGGVAGLCWPSTLRYTPTGTATAEQISPFSFLGGAAGGQLIGQIILTGGPVLLALDGGSAAEVTALFAGLALFRAPYTLALGMVAQLTGLLTRLVLDGAAATLRRVRLIVLAGTAVGVVVAAVVGALVGPWLLPAIFGANVTLDRLPSTLVAVGSALALANLVTTIMILAQGRGPAVARAWLLGTVIAAAVFALASSDALTRTCLTFFAAEAAAFVALTIEELRGSDSAGPKLRLRGRGSDRNR